MDRSFGFGSTTSYYIALFRLAFASAPILNILTSQHVVTRRPVLQKVRSHTCPCGRCAPTACKHTVSGSLSLPSRGAFHLSLTVLYSIGHQVVFSLRRWASRIPTEFLVLDGTLDTQLIENTFRVPDFHRLWSTFPGRSATYSQFVFCVRTPYIFLYTVWALTRSLATT